MTGWATAILGIVHQVRATWFMALNTRAPPAHEATSSAPDVVSPTAGPVKSAFSGLVQSMTIFPARPPQVRMASRVACHGLGGRSPAQPQPRRDWFSRGSPLPSHSAFVGGYGHGLRDRHGRIVFSQSGAKTSSTVPRN